MKTSQEASGKMKAGLAAALILFMTVGILAASRTSEGQSSAQITQSWVDQKTAQWQPASYRQMSFGAMIVPASYDQLEYSYNTPQVLQGYLGVMEGSGAGYVRIDVGYDPWLSSNTAAQGKIETLVNQIKSDGKGFILADASAEAYRGSGALNWAQFKQVWVQRVSTLAAVFHPDYYIVIKEPGWYTPMITDAMTNPQVQDPNQWLQLTQNLTDAVLAASPNTKVGVAIAADSLNQNSPLYTAYLRGLANIKGLSFMGFDIYTTPGFDSTSSYLSRYGSGGLDVWMAECWSASTADVVFDPSRATLDAGWMNAAYYFAQSENMSMMVPFFTNTFAAYNLTRTSPTDPTQILALQQQRTPVYHMYQNVTSGAENLIRTTTTTATTTQTTSGQASTTTTTTASKQSSGGQSLPTLKIAIGAAVVAAVVVIAVLATRKRR